MANELAGQIASSLSAKGQGTQEGAMAARNAYLESIAPQPQEDILGLADAIEMVNKATAEMSFAEADSVRTQLWGLLEGTQDYQGLNIADREKVRNGFMTQLTAKGQAAIEALDPNDPVNSNILKMYGQYQQMRNGEQVDINGWEAFGKSFVRASSVGGAVFGGVNLLTEVDQKERLMGTDVVAMEQMLESTAERYSPAEAIDMKRGRAWGFVAGIGADMAATVALGNVTGLTAKGIQLGRTAQQAIMGASAAGRAAGKASQMARLGALSARYLIPNSLEAGIFIAEEGVNRWVNNEMDTNEDIAQFVKDIPGTFAQGLAYAMIGEAVFGGIGSLAKKSKRATTDALTKAGKALPPSGADRAVAKAIATEAGFEGTTGEMRRLTRQIASDFNTDTRWTKETFAQRLKSYTDAGIDEETAIGIVHRQQRAASLKDPDTWLNEDRLNEEGLRNIWGAEFDITDSGDYRFTRFLDKKLETPEVITKGKPEELTNFFKRNYEVQWNNYLAEARLSAGFFTKKAVIKAQTAGALSRDISMNANSISKTFRSADGVVNKQNLDDLTEALVPRAKLKTRTIESDVFYKRKFDYEEGVVMIPKTVNSPAQSRDFAELYFDQVKKATARSGREVSYDIKDIKRILNKTTNLNYNKEMFRKLHTRVRTEELDGGKIRAFVGGNPVMRGGSEAVFDTAEEAIDYAAKQLHLETLGGIQGVQQHLAWRGIEIEMKDAKIIVKDNGEVYGEFNSIEDLLADKYLRPGLPAEKLPETFDINVFGDGKSHNTFGLDAKDKVVGVEGISKKLRTVSQDTTGYERVGKGSAQLKMSDPKLEGVEVYTNGPEVTIMMPDTAYSRTFYSAEDALKYLDNLDDRYKNVINRGAEHGLIVRPTTSGWYVGNDFEGAHLKTLQAVENFISRDASIRVRDIANTLDVSEGIKASMKNTEAITRTKKSFDNKLDKTRARAEKGLGSRVKAAFDRATKQTGARIRTHGNAASIEMYNTLESTYRKYDGHARQIHNRIQDMFKGYSEAEQNFMGMILQRETSPSEWKKIGAEMNKALGTDITMDARILNKLRETSEMFQEGGLQFGVEGHKWIQDYAPRMGNEKWLQDFDILKADSQDIGSDKLRQLLSKKVPEQDIPFFMHMRADEAGSYMLRTNVKDLLTQYYDTGLRMVYMKSPMDQLARYAKQIPNGDKIMREDLRLMKEMLDSINGRVVDTPTAQKIHSLNQIKNEKKNQIFHDFAGSDDKRTMDELFGSAMENSGQTFEQVVKRLEDINAMQSGEKFWSSAINSALMAWNMRMPIRNVGQMYTNLAPVVGLKYTNRAVRDILGNKEIRERLLKKAFDNGIIVPDGKFHKIHNVTDFLDNNLNAGMYVFRRSDDLTRLAAMRSTELRVDDALSKYRMDIEKGSFDPEVFLRELSADYLDAPTQSRILDMAAGRNNAAGLVDETGIKTLMQREVSLLTMYDYTPHVRPEAFRTQYGQIFGKMGTWPVAYFDLMRRGYSARGVEFMAKVFAAQAAVGVVYNDLLDMNGVAYTPVGNITFMGGPGLEGIPNTINGITSATAGLITGKKNFGEAAQTGLKSASWFLPFYKQIKNTSETVEAIQNDEYREGILTFLGANPNWNSPGLSGILGMNLEADKDYNIQSWWDGIADEFNWLD